jgi:glycosyltransferase involved in cell wall biosynthesis
MTTNFSLVLPCYNEEENIYHLYNEFKKIPLTNERAEIVFVNNGSLDSTEKKIDAVLKDSKIDKNSPIVIKKVSLTKNQGYGGGIAAGLKSAEGEYIGWAHADLQTPLADFYKLYMLVKSEKRIFGKGNRTNNRGYDGVISRFHEVCASLILGQKMREINAQPKIFHKSMLGLFTNIPTQWTTLDTYVFYICLINRIKIIEMDVIFKTRIYGQSKWKNNFVNFIKHLFFNIIYLIKLRFSK